MEKRLEVRELVKVMVEMEADVGKLLNWMDASYVKEVVEDSTIFRQIVSLMEVMQKTEVVMGTRCSL